MLQVDEVMHCSAAEERIFGGVDKNKASSHSSLSLSGTLLSIMLVKTHIYDTLQWKSPQDLLQKAKKTAIEYNVQHSTK